MLYRWCGMPVTMSCAGSSAGASHPYADEWMQILWSHAAVEAYGNDKGLLAGLKVSNLKTGGVFDLEVGRKGQAERPEATFP